MAKWEVTSVNFTQHIDPATGHLSDFIDVSFTTANGQGAGSVEVPKRKGWEDAARAAIQPVADEITAFIGSQG